MDCSLNSCWPFDYSFVRMVTSLPVVVVSSFVERMDLVHPYLHPFPLVAVVVVQHQTDLPFRDCSFRMVVAQMVAEKQVYFLLNF